MSKKNPFPVSSSKGHNSHKRFPKGKKLGKADHAAGKARVKAVLTNPLASAAAE